MSADADRFAALLRSARAAWQNGQAALAEACCREALALDSGDASAWALLGGILRHSDVAAAEAALGRALACSPDHPDAGFHLGNLYREQGRFREAVAAYERALATSPQHPSLLNNFGLALQGDGKHQRAIDAYRAALAAQPGHRQALGNLAHLLCELLDHAAARELCEEYLRRFPDAGATVWVDYGICQHHAGDYDGAEASFRRALEIVPDDALILTNLGSVLVDRYDFEHAEAVLARAAARDPSLLYASSLLAHCRCHLCRWDGLADLHAAILAPLEAGSDQPVNAFVALSIPMSPATQLRIARRWARSLAPPMTAPAPTFAGARDTARLRIGYVSSDFRTHAIAALLAEVWERHDRTRLETHAYSIGPRETSPLRARIEAAFGHFVECSGETAAQVARRIRDDGVDLLIDLNGYTTHAKSELFALRPAPVQLSWLGYLGTLGAPWYDYVITDRFVTPPAAQAFFSERFAYLPECYCPSDTKRPVATTVPARAACGLPERGLVFCCFNNSYKILPAVFEIWMRLLGAVPGSVLWLAPGSVTAAANLRREAAARGVDPLRLVFAPRVGLSEHLARHAHADLFLDTTPYNAGTAANDALFMGVPVLTCAGDTMASRVAGSQLNAIGLPELVTTRLADYEALALALAVEASLLRGYRARLAANRTTHPLFDMARFTHGLDDLLVAAWENRLAPHP
jgi:predicted O-linked N-acetylglucosamine transferase (SPINDLY family)